MMVYIILSMLSVALALAIALIYWHDRYQVMLMRDDLDRMAEERNIIIDFLHRTAEDFGADNDRQKLYQHIVRVTALSCGAMSACIYEKLSDGKLKVKAVEGLFPPLTFQIAAQEKNSLRSKFLESSINEEVVEPNEGVIGEVANSQKGILVRDAIKDPRIIKHADQSLQVKSLMVVPLIFAGQLHGVMAVANPISGKSFSNTDFSLAKSLGEQAGLAIHNSDAVAAIIMKNKVEFDLRLASSVQRYLLPAKLPKLENLDFAVKYHPQKLIGGDFYDFYNLQDEKLGVVIGDVSGKGISAAIIMALCQTTLRHLAEKYQSPSKVLRALNAEMVKAMRSDMFVTVIYAIIDKNKSSITLARAGHEVPIIYKADVNKVERIKSPGMAVGMVESEIFDAVIDDTTVAFDSGDLLVLYTDGITEVANAEGVEFSTNKLAELTQILSTRSAKDFNREIMASINKYIGSTEFPDDFTLLSIKHL